MNQLEEKWWEQFREPVTGPVATVTEPSGIRHQLRDAAVTREPVLGDTRQKITVANIKAAMEKLHTAPQLPADPLRECPPFIMLARHPILPRGNRSPKRLARLKHALRMRKNGVVL